MKQISLTFHLHQPFRLKRYRFFDIGHDHYYYDDFTNEEVLRRIAHDSYLPACLMLQEMLDEDPNFKFAIVASGMVLEQLEFYAPEVIHKLQQMAQTKRVEFLVEPMAHSLCSLYDQKEFAHQLQMHAAKLESLFGSKPQVVCNTELIHSNEIAHTVAKLGYKGIYTEGAKHILGWKSPNFLYAAPETHLPLILRNNILSDGIEKNFSRYDWEKYPYTADALFEELKQQCAAEQVVNLYFNLEILGNIWPAETGIFLFFRAFTRLAKQNEIQFATPEQLIETEVCKEELNIHYPISKFGEEKNVAIWSGNKLQQGAISKLKQWGPRVRLSSDPRLLQDWVYLQNIDHLFYMTTMHGGAGNFSPYQTPYDAFSNYMNILSDFLLRVETEFPASIGNEELQSLVQTIRNQDQKIARLEKQLAAQA